jgi:hypothetical protein
MCGLGAICTASQKLHDEALGDVTTRTWNAIEIAFQPELYRVFPEKDVHC